MKPLLTHSRPTLLETLPVCCNPVARLLTTTEQLTQVGLIVYLRIPSKYANTYLLCFASHLHYLLSY